MGEQKCGDDGPPVQVFSGPRGGKRFREKERRQGLDGHRSFFQPVKKKGKREGKGPERGGRKKEAEA